MLIMRLPVTIDRVANETATKEAWAIDAGFCDKKGGRLNWIL